MIQIEEPPKVAACAPCMSPILWLYSARTERWVSFVADPERRDTIRKHACNDRYEQPRTWRTLVPQPPEIQKAGARRVRDVLASRLRAKDITDVD